MGDKIVTESFWFSTYNNAWDEIFEYHTNNETQELNEKEKEVTKRLSHKTEKFKYLTKSGG